MLENDFCVFTHIYMSEHDDGDDVCVFVCVRECECVWLYFHVRLFETFVCGINLCFFTYIYMRVMCVFTYIYMHVHERVRLYIYRHAKACIHLSAWVCTCHLRQTQLWLVMNLTCALALGVSRGRGRRLQAAEESLREQRPGVGLLHLCAGLPRRG